jgi:hypothetical protein
VDAVSTLSSLDIDFSNLPKRSELTMSEEVGKVLSFFRPAEPLGEALAKRDGIREAVGLHCKRVGLSASQTASCVDTALACYGIGKSPAIAVAEGRMTANRLAYELGGGGPKAA